MKSDEISALGVAGAVKKRIEWMNSVMIVDHYWSVLFTLAQFCPKYTFGCIY